MASVGSKNNSPTGSKNNSPPGSKATEAAQQMFNKMSVSTPTKNTQPAVQTPKSSATASTTKSQKSWSEEMEAQDKGKGKEEEEEDEEEEEENSGDESEGDDTVDISTVVPQAPVQKKVAPPPKPPVSNKNTQSAKNKPVVQETKNTSTKKMLWVEGSNIGDSASEPNWTDNQIQNINAALHVRLPIKVVADTRRVVPDEKGQYVTHDNKGASVTRAPAFLNNINVQQYCVGMGKAKGDQKTGKTKLYSDIVNGTWITNQWTCRDVVIEGVRRKILDRIPRTVHSSSGSNKERRVGHEFARIGLPKIYFGPVFETLRSKYPKIMASNVSTTLGYYWVNASWGVTGNPGRFEYLVAPGKTVETQKLAEVMRMFDGKSSLCQATIAISTAFNGKLSGHSVIRDGDSCELSIKIHNAFHLKKVDYRSPPQSASTGFELTDDLMQESEVLAAEKVTKENVFSEFMNEGNEDDDNDNNDDEDDDLLI